jgi:hypothetical protein
MSTCLDQLTATRAKMTIDLIVSYLIVSLVNVTDIKTPGSHMTFEIALCSFRRFGFRCVFASE